MILARKKKKASWFMVFMLLCSMMVLNGFSPISAEGSAPSFAASSSATQSNENAVVSPRPTYNPSNPQILQDKFLYADTAVLIEQHTGKILYDMRAEKRMQPASITKTMTLLVALENGNLQDEVTVGKEILQVPADSSKMPLLEGETLTLEALLYGLIIRSGNDAAMTIATHIGGSVEGFVDMMNKRAVELGCSDTHFMNPHGYEDENHYTTALDMARIAQQGMENEAFRQIVGTPSFTIQPNNKRLERYTMKTKNRFVEHDENLEYMYPYGTGIKTGFFTAAQHTFIASATKDDVDLIAVVMKTTQKGKWIDAARLMEYGFAIYHPYSVQDMYETAPVYLNVEGCSQDDPEAGRLKLELQVKETPFTLGDTEEQIEKMKTNFGAYYIYEAEQTLMAPVEQGAIVGTLVFRPEEGQAYYYNMVASRDVAEQEKRKSIFRIKDNHSSSEGLQENEQNRLIILGGIAIVLALAVVIMIVLITYYRRKDRKRK